MCVRVEERAQRLFSLAQEREPADGGRGWGDCIQEGEQVEWERDKEGKQVMLGSPGRVSGEPEAAAGWWYTVVAAPLLLLLQPAVWRAGRPTYRLDRTVDCTESGRGRLHPVCSKPPSRPLQPVWAGSKPPPVSMAVRWRRPPAFL